MTERYITLTGISIFNLVHSRSASEVFATALRFVRRRQSAEEFTTAEFWTGTLNYRRRRFGRAALKIFPPHQGAAFSRLLTRPDLTSSFERTTIRVAGGQ